MYLPGFGSFLLVLLLTWQKKIRFLILDIYIFFEYVYVFVSLIPSVPKKKKCVRWRFVSSKRGKM